MSDESFTTIEVELPEEFLEILQSVAVERDVSIEQIITEAIEQFVERYRAKHQV
jgi:predicted transcriptional regulator